MRPWARWFYLLVAMSTLIAGCKSSSSSSSSSVVISPAGPTVLVGGLIQFAATAPSATATITWSVNGSNGANGTIDANGLYTAPTVVPAGATITVTATQGNASGSTTVTVNSGVALSVTPSSATIGTLETFAFTATVTGVPAGAMTSTCGTTTTPPCTAVTWSVTSGTGSGTIDPNTGIYTAPSAAHADTITATSIYDTTKTATATANVVAAAAPTITSISPSNGATAAAAFQGAVGALFQDVYLTGTNFISTTKVFVDPGSGPVQVPPAEIFAASSETTILVRLGLQDSFLTASGTLTFTVSSQSGMPQACSVAAQCQLLLAPVRPAVVGTTPDSVALPSGSGTPPFNVNGGYFGTGGKPAVTVQVSGQAETATVNNPRQLSVAVGSSAINTPGLHPVAVLQQSNTGAGAPRAVANLAVQPSYSAPPVGATSPCGASVPVPCTLPVGTSPAAVGIDTATGIAVVANNGSSDVTLLDLTASPPAVVAPSICTSGTQAAPCSPTGPVSVAVDNLRHIALVANSVARTVTVVDLAARSVKAVIPSGPTSISGVPEAVGINPITGTAIVAYQTSGYASLVDLTQPSPAVTGIVDISNGPTPRISVSAKLNWALVTPGSTVGSSGSLSIVDLSQQTVVPIAANGVSCATGTVTINTAPAVLGLQVGQVVLVNGVGNAGFNGVFTVLSVPSASTFTYSVSSCPAAASTGGAISFANPVATLTINQGLTGVAFNQETDKAILVGPEAGTPTILSALDQTSSTVGAGATPVAEFTGIVGAAFNPLTNIAVTVNRTTGDALVIDPATPTVLATFPVGGSTPVDIAIDPGTNEAIVANQGSGTAGIISLGAISSPEVLQVSATPGSPVLPGGANVMITSTLASQNALGNQTFTIIGKGFSGSPMVRLDGDPSPVQSATVLSDRVMTVTLSGAALQANGPRRYDLDVVNGGVVSNASGFTVIQSIDVSGACTVASATPQGVAIDPQHDIAVVTNSGVSGANGCNNVSLISLAPGALEGTGKTVTVGTQPVGVDVLPGAGLAVVANFGSTNASIVDVVGGTVVTTVANLDLNPTGVAIDQLLGEAVVSSAGANVLDTFPVNTTVTASSGTINVLTRPSAIAIDPTTHLAAVADVGSDSVSLVNLSSSSTASTFTLCSAPSVCLPEAVIFDPVTRKFVAALSLNNAVSILDPVAQTGTQMRVGINPTSMAYNAASGTLVTMNNVSHTMTVVDFIDQRVRAVLPMPSSTLFGVAIHPRTNLAVVADSAGNRVLLVPLPR